MVLAEKGIFITGAQGKSAEGFHWNMKAVMDLSHGMLLCTYKKKKIKIKMFYIAEKRKTKIITI